MTPAEIRSIRKTGFTRISFFNPSSFLWAVMKTGNHSCWNSEPIFHFLITQEIFLRSGVITGSHWEEILPIYYYRVLVGTNSVIREGGISREGSGVTT